jgi:hypothetical protein
LEADNLGSACLNRHFWRCNKIVLSLVVVEDLKIFISFGVSGIDAYVTTSTCNTLFMVSVFTDLCKQLIFLGCHAILLD